MKENEATAVYDIRTNAAIGTFVGFLTPDQFKETAIELLKKYDSRFKTYTNKSIQTTLNEIFAPDFHGNKIKRFSHLPTTIENGQNVYMNGSVIAISVDAYKSLHEQGYIK